MAVLKFVRFGVCVGCGFRYEASPGDEGVCEPCMEDFYERVAGALLVTLRNVTRTYSDTFGNADGWRRDGNRLVKTYR